MSQPSVIVFDLGKVLVDFDYSIAARRIAAKSATKLDIAEFFTTHAPLMFDYEVGTISTREFFGAMCRASGFTGTPEEFADYFADIFTEIPDMIRLHAELREKGFPTFIFSNTNELAVTHIRRRFPFFANFDGYLYSYQHRAMKPDRKFYDIVERETKRRGKEIVYIDDRPENAAAGSAHGWHAVMHETPEKTRAALQQIGVLG